MHASPDKRPACIIFNYISQTGWGRCLISMLENNPLLPQHDISSVQINRGVVTTAGTASNEIESAVIEATELFRIPLANDIKILLELIKYE